MAIRLPSSPVLDVTSTIASAITDSATVLLPQDCDGVVVKLWAPVFGATSDDVYIQTSDDGGTTWFDMANMGQVTAAIVAANARWAFFPVIGTPARTQGASVVAIGAAAASTAAVQTYTGLPVMGRNFRVFFKMAGSGASTVRVQVFANSQSATA